MKHLRKPLDKELKTPDQVARGLVELRRRAAELRGEFDKATASQQAAMKTAEATGKAAAESLDRIAGRLKGKKGFAAYDEAQTALQGFRAALTDPGLNVEKLRELADAVQPLADRTGLLKWAGIYNVQNVNDFSAALEALIKKSKALETLSAPTLDASELQQLESIIQRLKPGPAVQEGVEPSREIAGNLWSAAQATGVISRNLSGSGNVAHKALGGARRAVRIQSPPYFRPGNLLSTRSRPGDSCPNSRQSTPESPRSIGKPAAPVTNVTVGDINISESKGPRTTAREVVAAIRREQRRGVVS